MRITALILLQITFAFVATAGTPATFEESKALSIQSGKPILLEFVRED
jgi:uncharacterized membrane protein YkvI